MADPESPENLKQLCSALLIRRREWDDATDAFFDQLKAVDPPLHEALLQAFGDGTKAMSWLASSRPVSGHSPVELIAKGRRQEVMDELTRIDHGVFS